MKRSFRMATVFTGAAACAVTLAPVAKAAPAKPDASAGNCPAGIGGQQVHLYYTAAEKHPRPACVSSFGYIYIGAGKKFSYYCGGAWSGWFWMDGNVGHFTDGGVYHHLYGVSVSAISLSKFNSRAGACDSKVP